MIRSLTIVLMFALTTACGGGGGGGSSDSGGVGGSGITRGVITRLGSATLAGTNFDTTTAEFEIEGEPGTLADLALGMKLTVEGPRDAGGETGTAELVVFDDDIEGPIDEILTLTPDRKELSILDQTVVIHRATTLFDGGVDFDTIDLDDVVEVSGLRSEAAIDATRVLLTTTLGSDPNPPVELKGTVANLMADQFTIGAVTVTFDSGAMGTDLTGVPGGVLMDGDFVEVEGSFDGPDAVDATAGSIEIEERELAGTVDDVQIEGLVSDFENLQSFRVGGQQVDATTLGVVFVPTDPAFIANGARVEVEGQLDDGLLVASEVRLRDAEVRIRAEIADAADIDAMANTLVLLGEITIELGPGTSLEGLGDLMDLAAGDFVEVRGVPVGDVVQATLLRLEGSSDDVLLVGPVEAFDATLMTFTVLDVEIPTNDETDFDDIPGVEDEADFYAYLGALIIAGDRPLHSVEDEDDGDATTIDVADEVEPIDEVDEVLVAAEVASDLDVDLGANVLTLLGSVAISFDDLDDDDFDACAAIPGFNGLDDVGAGDFLVIEGFRLPGGLVQATDVSCEDVAGDVELVGRVEAFDGGAGNFTILGVVVDTDGGTTFDDFPGSPLTEAEFYAFLTANPTAVLEVIDEVDGDATAIDQADDVEFEDDGD